jgi:glycolate oxidase FAD binding subunit
MSTWTVTGLADVAVSRWGSAARLPGPADALFHLTPAVVLAPKDVATLATMLRWANDEKLAVVPRGAGTKRRWGALPTRVDILLSLSRMTTPIEHCAGDLTATLPAGAPLAQVNAVLGRERQWLPIDPLAGDRSTVGGMLATNDSGPRRLRYGAPRDLVIGVEMVLADGREAKAGGKVVKNVAGYDLGRLLCGSFGSLAVVTRATFKLSPLPSASRTVVATVAGAREAGELMQAIAASPLSPSAIELDTRPFRVRLLVRFETTAAAADAQATHLRQVCEQRGAATALLTADEEVSTWSSYAAAFTANDDTLLKVLVLPTEVGSFVELVSQEGGRRAVGWTVSGCAALGVLYCKLIGPDEQHGPIVDTLRRELAARSGKVVILSAGAELKRRVAPWGDLAAAGQVIRAVKAQFDPNNTLNPGGGPGGLS